MGRSRRGFLRTAGAAGAAVASLATAVGAAGAPRDVGDGHPLHLDTDPRAKYSTAGRRLDDLADPADWVATHGTATVDTDRTYRGEPTLRLGPDGTHDKTVVVRTFPDGIDLSGHDLSVAVRVDTGPVHILRGRLLAPDWDHGVALRREGINPWTGWLRADLGVTYEFGRPDLSDVRGVAFRVDFDPAVGLDLWLSDLRVTPKADAGKVLFTFDDSLASTYHEAFPVLAEFDFPAYVSTITGEVGDRGHTTLDELSALADAGWTVGSHTCTHPRLTTLPRADQHREIREAKEWLLDHGFAGADTIVYPHSAASATTLDLSSQYHVLGFAGGSNTHGARLTDPLTVGRVNGDHPGAVREAVRLAAKYRQVAPLMYHDVGPDATLSTAAFRESVQHVAATDDVDVVTTADLRGLLSDDAGPPLGHDGTPTSTTGRRTTTPPETTPPGTTPATTPPSTATSQPTPETTPLRTSTTTPSGQSTTATTTATTTGATRTATTSATTRTTSAGSTRTTPGAATTTDQLGVGPAAGALGLTGAALAALWRRRRDEE